MNRRGFLGAILAAPAAPLALKAEASSPPFIAVPPARIDLPPIEWTEDVLYASNASPISPYTQILGRTILVDFCDTENRIAAFEDEMSNEEYTRYQAATNGVEDREKVLEIAMAIV